MTTITRSNSAPLQQDKEPFCREGRTSCNLIQVNLAASPTFEDSSDDEDENRGHDRQPQQDEECNEPAANDPNKNSSTENSAVILTVPAATGSTWTAALSIAAYSYLGVVLRVYLGRGFDCGSNPSDPNDNDASSSSEFCLTSYDSPLFVDLPANVVGCFVLGVIMQHAPQHAGMIVGFCGSLTTFASWNMQMVRMMEEGHVANAVGGYFLGTICAMGSYALGLEVVSGNRGLPFTAPAQNQDRPDDEESVSTTSTSRRLESLWQSITNQFHSVWLPSLLCSTLMILFAVLLHFEDDRTTTDNAIHEDDGDDNTKSLYRNLLGMSVTAPLGALLRWQVSVRLPQFLLHFRPSSGCVQQEYAPLMATLVANLLAVIWYSIWAGLGHNEQVALTTGFAGSLSTVSTWIKECHRHKSLRYVLVTVLSAAVLGYGLYTPLIRRSDV